MDGFGKIFTRNSIAGWWRLEHEFYFSIQLGISSSQLTNSSLFRWLNHQPAIDFATKIMGLSGLNFPVETRQNIAYLEEVYIMI